MFKNKHISITGATGFLGTHLSNYFIENGDNVFCLIKNEMYNNESSVC